MSHICDLVELNGVKIIVKYILVIVISFVLLTSATAQESESENGIISVEEAINVALRSHPSIKAAEWKAVRARESARQAGSWMDPMITFGLVNVPYESYAFNQEPMTGKKISLMQQIPFPGKLGAKKAAAISEAEAVSEEIPELEGYIVKRVKESYYDIFVIDWSVKITNESLDLLSRFVEIAETRYSVGRGIQQDVLKAQVERSKFEERLINLQFKREKSVAKLNTLMNRDSDSPIKVIENLTPTEFLYTERELTRMAEEQRPALKAGRYRITAKERRADYSRKLKLPDFGIGVAYTQRDELIGANMPGADFISMTVGFSLPIKPGNRQSSKVEQSKAETRMEREQYNNFLNNVKQDIKIHYAEMEKGKSLIALYTNQILPQAEQSFNSALSGYQVDKVDFITLLNNEVTLFNYRINYYRILSDYEKSIAAIEAVVGFRINKLRGE